MPVPSRVPLIDKAIPGGLEKHLRDARNRGESFRTIATGLAAFDVAATYTTVGKWCADYGIDTARITKAEAS